MQPSTFIIKTAEQFWTQVYVDGNIYKSLTWK